MDQFVALERRVSSLSYFDGRHTVEDLKQRTDLVMDIQERALRIEDEARERRASRHLRTATGWLPIGLKIWAALIVAVVLLAMDRTQHDQLLHWIVSSRATPYGAVAMLGGGMIVIAKRLQRRGSESESLDAEGTAEESGPT
jgi:hypothetical protein